MRHSGCCGDPCSLGIEQLHGKSTCGHCVWLQTNTQRACKQVESSILEKAWLVCHLVVMQHSPPLPLELFYPLFLLLSCFWVPLLQQPGQIRQGEWVKMKNSRKLVFLTHHPTFSRPRPLHETGKVWLSLLIDSSSKWLHAPAPR